MRRSRVGRRGSRNIIMVIARETILGWGGSHEFEQDQPVCNCTMYHAQRLSDTVQKMRNKRAY